MLPTVSISQKQAGYSGQPKNLLKKFYFEIRNFSKEKAKSIGMILESS